MCPGFAVEIIILIADFLMNVSQNAAIEQLVFFKIKLAVVYNKSTFHTKHKTQNFDFQFYVFGRMSILLLIAIGDVHSEKGID